jgi:elongation factor 1-gamma
MELWGTITSPNTRIIEAASNFAGDSIKHHEFVPALASKDELKNYTTSINANGTVPSLAAPEGKLGETGAILRYLARTDKTRNLYGANLFQESSVDQWLDWTSQEFLPVYNEFLGPYFGQIEYDKLFHDQISDDVKKLIKILNDQLKKTKFLVGDHLTIADLLIAGHLSTAYQFLWEEKPRKQNANLLKWYETITGDENWKKAFGKTVLCKTALPIYTESKKVKKDTGKKKKEESKEAKK